MVRTRLIRNALQTSCCSLKKICKNSFEFCGLSRNGRDLVVPVFFYKPLAYFPR
jgi:hypothetical protein